MPTNGQQIILSHFCRKINRSWSSSQMWCRNGFQKIFLYKGEKLQVEEASFKRNHGAQPILARRTYSTQLITIPWPCCCIEYTWEDGKNTWCEEYIFHSLLLYLLLLFITLSVLCSKLLKPTEWLSFETPSGSGTWLESKSANLLLFCARVTVGPPPSKLFRHISNLNWDMDMQIWIELLCQLLNKSIRLTVP